MLFIVNIPILDFHKIGGFGIFDILQKDDKDDGFKWRCGDLIATLCQNNPYCQQKLLHESEQMDRLMALVRNITETEKTRVKALYALSGILRLLDSRSQIGCALFVCFVSTLFQQIRT